MSKKRITIDDFKPLKESMTGDNQQRFSDFIVGLTAGVLVMYELKDNNDQLDELLFQTKFFCENARCPEISRLPDLESLLMMILEDSRRKSDDQLADEHIDALTRRAVDGDLYPN